ncbi:hypothetical protein DVQ40_01065 [Yersinia enterocolitica]|nr:hypothetical protein [Yersinia enterocolitica]
MLKQASLGARAAPSVARTLYSSTCLHLARPSYRGFSGVSNNLSFRLQTKSNERDMCRRLPFRFKYKRVSRRSATRSRRGCPFNH